MSTVVPDNPPLSIHAPSSIVRLLGRLRQKIRRYVLIEGMAMTTIWLVVAFWCMLAMDYLPVQLGASEMPRQARMVLLGMTGAGVLVVVYWYVLRRVFFAFRDSSLAILIERQFPEFRDSLVTTVQMGAGLDDVDDADFGAIEAALSEADIAQGRRMLRDTVERAEANTRSVRLAKVFNYRPLAYKVAGAIAALASIVLLGIFGGDVLGVGASRLLALSEQPWPRRARIEMVGFENNEHKIAKGTDLTVYVRADAQRAFPPPELCTILYQTSDGESGRVNMSRDGEPRDGFQYYVFNGKPFKGVLNDIRFDVIGYDHRLRDQRLKVVASPVVTGVELQSVLPAYLEQESRLEKWNPGLQLPVGSQVRATVEASKPLLGASVRDIDTGEQLAFDFASNPRTSWELDLRTLTGRKAVAITLHDTDAIESLEPHLLTIGAVEDTVPNVDVTLRGIGSAITAQARLPMEGTIQDDYDLNRTWFQVQLEDAAREFDFSIDQEDAPLLAALDLREESAADKTDPLKLQPQDRLLLSVKATDQYDLDDGSHIGSSEVTTLTVVRSDELLAILDGRELGLRRRFEQIRSEMMQSRDSLARLRGSFKESDGSEEESAANLQGLRERWAGWASQKGEQSSEEVEGIALAFEDIREELVNNRVDTEERKLRMEDQIIGPLREISGKLFPKWQESLGELRAMLTSNQREAEPKSIQVVGEADQILVAMDAILEKMLELEDYTELINIVRQIIEQQESLMEKTKEEQKARVLDFLD